jgi:putative ABC transport system permease protein
VVLKVLGASRAQIRAAWLVEFGVLGLTAGLIAALVGSVASWGWHIILWKATGPSCPGPSPPRFRYVSPQC